MIGFNLEEYRKGKKVTTADGREVKILSTDRLSQFPIVALVKDHDLDWNDIELLAEYTIDGKFQGLNQGEPKGMDLIHPAYAYRGAVEIYIYDGEFVAMGPQLDGMPFRGMEMPEGSEKVAIIPINFECGVNLYPPIVDGSKLNTESPEVTEEGDGSGGQGTEKKQISRKARKVCKLDARDKIVEVYDSVSDLARKIGIRQTYLSKKLNSDKPCVIEGITYRFYEEIDETLRQIEESDRKPYEISH